MRVLQVHSLMGALGLLSSPWTYFWRFFKLKHIEGLVKIRINRLIPVLEGAWRILLFLFWFLSQLVQILALAMLVGLAFIFAPLHAIRIVNIILVTIPG